MDVGADVVRPKVQYAKTQVAHENSWFWLSSHTHTQQQTNFVCRHMVFSSTSTHKYMHTKTIYSNNVSLARACIAVFFSCNGSGQLFFGSYLFSILDVVFCSLSLLISLCVQTTQSLALIIYASTYKNTSKSLLEKSATVYDRYCYFNSVCRNNEEKPPKLLMAIT